MSVRNRNYRENSNIGRIRELEILRVAATLVGDDHVTTATLARTSVLRWAQRRRGSMLPPEAWEGQSFEYLAGGRTCVGVRLQAGETDLWALRADDPDKTIAGRVWTTEVVVGHRGDDPPLFSARLFVATGEDEIEIDVAAPGFIRQVANSTGLKTGAYEADDHAWWISNESDADELIRRLVDNERGLPLVIISTGDAGYDSSNLLIDPDGLASAMIGLAHVAVLPEQLTWRLSQALGRPLSVFNGGIRLYQPGFSSDDDPYGPHDLILARQIDTIESAGAAVRWLKERLAAASVRRVRLGSGTISYQDVRDAVLINRQNALEVGGASDEDKLAAANARIISLEERRASDAEWQGMLEADNVELDKKAKAFEALANANRQRVKQLTEAIQSRGESTDIAEDLPTNWPEFDDWCDRSFPGRLVLSARARREAKGAEFEDVAQAARVLIWLAGEYRDARLSGGVGSMRDRIIEGGIRNSPSGADAYETKWKNENREVDWHVKNGGNTRDPRRCLRAYYFWDEHSEQVVVDHLPSHRSTGAS